MVHDRPGIPDKISEWQELFGTGSEPQAWTWHDTQVVDRVAFRQYIGFQDIGGALVWPVM